MGGLGPTKGTGRGGASLGAGDRGNPHSRGRLSRSQYTGTTAGCKNATTASKAARTKGIRAALGQSERGMGGAGALPAVSAPPIKDARQPFYSAGETGCGFLEVRPTSGDKHRAPRFRAPFAILARASAVADATAIERTVTVNAVTVDATSRVCCEFGRYLYETASCAGPTSTCLRNAEVSTSAATLICGNGGSFAR